MRERRRDKADEMFVRKRGALRRDKVERAKDDVVGAKEGLNSSENTMSKLGMLIKAYGNLLKAKSSSIIEVLLADLTCEYGTNWERPVLLWIFVVFILSPVLYLALGWISGGVSINSLTEFLHSYPDYLYISLSNVTPL